MAWGSLKMALIASAGLLFAAVLWFLMLVQNSKTAVKRHKLNQQRQYRFNSAQKLTEDFPSNYMALLKTITAASTQSDLKNYKKEAVQLELFASPATRKIHQEFMNSLKDKEQANTGDLKKKLLSAIHKDFDKIYLPPKVAKKS